MRKDGLRPTEGKEGDLSVDVVLNLYHSLVRLDHLINHSELYVSRHRWVK